jgi:hypothetical protein
MVVLGDVAAGEQEAGEGSGDGQGGEDAKRAGHEASGARARQRGAQSFGDTTRGYALKGDMVPWISTENSFLDF